MNFNRITTDKQNTLINITNNALKQNIPLKEKQELIEKEISAQIRKSPLPFIAQLNNPFINESKTKLHNHASMILKKSRLPKPMKAFMTPELLTAITLTVLINLFHAISQKSSKISRISLIRAISDLILRQLSWKNEKLNSKVEEKKTRTNLEKTHKEQQRILDKTELTSKTLAAKIVECLSDSDVTIEHLETKITRNTIKTTKYLQLSDNWTHIASQTINPRTKLPMIYEPLAWKLSTESVDNHITGINLQQGGYLTINATDRPTALLSKLGCIYRAYHTQDSCNAINYLQSVPFRIDKDLLDYMKKNSSLIPKYADYEKIVSVSKIDYSFIGGKINYKLGEVYDLALNYVSNVDYSLEIASMLSGMNLFFPVNHDGRGRLYPIAFPITPIAHNYIRSLIRVPETYNFTKASYPNEWDTFVANIAKGTLGKDNEKTITQFKKNPARAFKKIYEGDHIKDFSILTKRDLYLQRGGDTSQLIGLDVTASGLQIMGIGTRDLKALKLTNVFQDNFNEYSEKDIYYKIHERVAKDYPVVKDFDRKQYKNVIMRLSYGEGNSSRQKILSEFFQENNKDGSIHLSPQNTLFSEIAERYDEALYEEFPKFELFKSQIVSIVKAKVKLNMPICLEVSPHLSSTQYYTKDKATTYSFRDHKGKPKRVTMFIPTKISSSEESRFEAKPMASKMLRATLPNLIHHIDSLIAHKIILKFREEKKPIFTIHDAFYVRLVDTTLLKKTYFNELRVIHDYNFWESFLLTNTVDLTKSECVHLTKKQKLIAEQLNALINEDFLPETKLSPIDFDMPMSPKILS